jgi:hypothetical protein
MKNIFKIILYICIFAGFCGIFMLYLNTDNKVNEHLRIADSLRLEVNKYHKQYDSLLVVANKLDSSLANQAENVKIIKKSFIVYKTPPINNADTAVKFLQDFIKE